LRIVACGLLLSAGLLLHAGLLLAADPLAAQVPAEPRLYGQVLRGGAVLPEVEVILHRVSMDQAGEIDTTRAGPRGDFTFLLPSVPTSENEGDVYFASVRHDGVLYFGPAVSRAIQLDSAYTVQVHDTVSAHASGAQLPLAVRYLVAEEGPGGWTVTDLFEVLNESDQTFVARPEGITWQHPLPTGIQNIQVGGGDLSATAATTDDGVLRLSGPIPPGQRQFVLRYTVPALDGFTVPVRPSTREVEFLVSEPAPDLEVTGLDALESVAMSPEVSFRRYAGPAPASGQISVSLLEAPRELPLRELAVGLALLLAAAGVWAAMRGQGGPRPASVGAAHSAGDGSARGGGSPPPPVAPDPVFVDERRKLMVEVARIDEVLAAGEVDDGEAERLGRKRANLITRIRNLG
jgi:hypothetical protein